MDFLNSNLAFDASFSHGDGAYLYDVNGERFFDVWLGSGTLLFGHGGSKKNNGEVEIDLLPDGKRFSDNCWGLVRDLVDFKIKALGFQTGGSSAVSRACRLARALTNRKKIAVIGDFWHGSDDAFLFKKSNQIISTGVFDFQLDGMNWYKDFQSFLDQRDLSEFAGVIVEPLQGANPSVSTFDKLGVADRSRLKSEGVFLIVDEVITGFREQYGSCLSSREIKPDIVIFGKTIGLGFPVGLVLLSEDAPISSNKMPFWGGTFAASPTQLSHVFSSLKCLSVFEYGILGSNLSILKNHIEHILDGTDFFLNCGKAFGRIAHKGSKQTTSRDFVSTQNSKIHFTEILMKHGLYVGNNGLVFPSSFCFYECTR